MMFYRIIVIYLIFLAATVCKCHKSSCPTWHIQSSNGTCVCGRSLQDKIVYCNDSENLLGVFFRYCLTSDGNNSIVGHCLARDVDVNRLFGPDGNYKKVSHNLKQQDYSTCGFLNRKGRLCGECLPNTSIHAYTYDMKCYPCKSSLGFQVVKYIAIAYIPLTVFLCIVVVFHISVTSPALNVPVLCCQLLSLPFALRFIWQYALRYPHIKPFVQLFGTIYGIWNLDFFRLIIQPICLRLDVMQLIALDLLVALYPLLLLVCFYIIVNAHDRGCKPVVKLFRPFCLFAARLRQQWNIRNSIIDAFASFILLSFIKNLNTSLDLLVFSSAYNESGAGVGRYLFNNPTVEFMGPGHIPYAIIAITVLVGLTLPLILLLLYPMKWFQVFMNKCHLNGPGLRMFMDSFQGYYHDRTDGGLECRYFAAVYPLARILNYFLYTMSNDYIFFSGCIILYLCVIALILVVQPYKKQYRAYIKVDILMFLSLILFLLGLYGLSDHPTSPHARNLKFGLVLFGMSSPIAYASIRGVVYVFKRFTLSCVLRNSKHHVTDSQALLYSSTREVN